LDDRALNEVMKKLFRNYKKWCKYLGRKSSLWWDLHIKIRSYFKC